MNRVKNWELVLEQAVQERENDCYEVGSFDCFLFTFGLLNKITGEDWFLKVNAPKYKTKTEGVKALKEQYNGSFVEMMDSVAKRKPVGFTQRGNVVGIEIDGGVALGMFVYPRAKFATDKGFLSLPISEIKYAWET